MTPPRLLPLALLLVLPARAAAYQQAQAQGPARLEVRCDGAGDSIALSDVVTPLRHPSLCRSFTAHRTLDKRHTPSARSASRE